MGFLKTNTTLKEYFLKKGKASKTLSKNSKIFRNIFPPGKDKNGKVKKEIGWKKYISIPEKYFPASFMSFPWKICSAAHDVRFPNNLLKLLFKLAKGLWPKVSIPIKIPPGFNILLNSGKTFFMSKEENVPASNTKSK